MAEDIERCLAAGMNDFVPKPVDPVTLVLAMARVLGIAGPGAVDEPADDDSIAVALAQAGDALDPGVIEPLCEQLGDDFVLDLLADYDEAATKHLANLAAALSADDMEALASVAHALKGASGALGLRKVFQLSMTVETAVANAHMEEARGGCAHLPDAVNEGRRLLGDYMDTRQDAKLEAI